MASSYDLEASYGKQSVPVFKIQKNGKHHSIVDIEVRIMLGGDIKASWLEGLNHQIVPTETQKNTCYAIALKTDFASIEQYGQALATHFLNRHGHLTDVTLYLTERVWERVTVGGTPHNHAFSSALNPTRRSCSMHVSRSGGTTVSSGIVGLKLMKTTQSGFQGYIQDEYTNLKPVGAGTANPDRIMCTEMDGSWSFAPGLDVNAFDFNKANATIRQLLIEHFAGPPDTGKFSKSLQETVYAMCTAVLDSVKEVQQIHLVTPNIHFYTWGAEEFGLKNPNVVFQSTDCRTSASGRIETKLSRPKASL